MPSLRKEILDKIIEDAEFHEGITLVERTGAEYETLGEETKATQILYFEDSDKSSDDSIRGYLEVSVGPNPDDTDISFSINGEAICVNEGNLIDYLNIESFGEKYHELSIIHNAPKAEYQSPIRPKNK